MKKIVLILVALVWLVSCETKPKTDFGKHYAEKYSGFIERLKHENISVKKSNLKNRSIQKNKKLFFANNLIQFKSGSDKFDITYIAFEDEKSKAAIQKIMLSEIGDIEKVKFGENKKHIKNNPLLIIFNTNEIIKMEYACACDLTKVKKISAFLESQFKTEQSKQLNVGCGGPVIWK